MANIHVKLTIGDKRVTLEGPEEFVRSEVQRLTGSLVLPPPSSTQTGAPPTGGADSDPPLPRTERDLVSAKLPSGHSEIVAVLAYFLTKNGQQQFTAEDMKRAYARARVRPPKAIAQALRDAKNLHDYLETGSDRGTFRLSPHGERTVEYDLPRRES